MSKILIIDDDKNLRLILEHALKSAGYMVTTASDGREGMKALHSHAVDLIITDLFMPNQEGLETITEIRKLLPAVPIIAMSGGHTASPAMLMSAKHLGAAQVLEKPFDAITLLQAVEKVLGSPSRAS